MKVIGIVGSPRKGSNTEILVKSVLDGARDAGADTEVFFLNELKINCCQGCNFCQENGVCKQQDDMSKIYNALHDADSIVIGSPIYIGYVSAQTKIFLDRLYALLRIGGAPRLKAGKRCVLISTQGGGNDGKSIMEGLSDFFKNAFGMSIDAIIAENNLNRLGAVKDKKDVLNKCYEIGKRLVSN